MNSETVAALTNPGQGQAHTRGIPVLSGGSEHGLPPLTKKLSSIDTHWEWKS